MIRRGKFITLEGGEGAGKSSQAKNLAAFLRTGGREVILTREVGGCPSAEEIREMWLSKNEGYWDPLTEVVLIMAARREHLQKTIWPSLDRGAWVISDRFIDSTRAYQGIAMGLGLSVIDGFYRQIAADFEPDMTVLLDLPIDAGLARVASRGGKDDRYQQRDKTFHQVLRDAYYELADIYPLRMKIVDAEADMVNVSKAIEAVVQTKFELNT